MRIGEEGINIIKQIIVGLIMGIVIGIYIDRKFFKRDNEMTTDDLVKALSDKGYWVRIGPRGNKED